MLHLRKPRLMQGTASAELFKGLVAGLAGGLAGSWTMNQFQALLSRLTQRNTPGQSNEQQGGREQSLSQGEQPSQQQQNQQSSEPATLLLVESVSTRLFHHKLTPDEKKLAEPAVHYGYGALAGALYGAATELFPVTTTGAVTAYATALWLLGDEIAVPALGLSKAPTQYPLSSHAQALAAHAVYGVTVELVRRAVREIV